MVHTLPAAHGAAKGATSGAGGSGTSVSGEREKFSGLRIADRELRPSRWEDLMRGKSYVPFDRLSSIESLEAGSKDAVMIGVVYEKSLKKTGSNGNEFVHWTFTDLAWPQPNVMTLFLHGQAFETWEKDAETPVAIGSILAILNPVPLANRKSGEKECRNASKVTFGTQLVRLGTCPSLGHCTCKKKDGMKCSMPCDRDKGPLVCYYHTMSQAAQQAKQWKGHGSSGTGSSTSTAARAAADGIFVLQAPARAKAGGAQPLSQAPRPGGPQPTAPSLSSVRNGGAPRPGGPQPTAPSLSSVRNGGKSGGGGIDAVTQRLLSGTPRPRTPAPAAKGDSSSGKQSSTSAGEAARGRPPATPARVAQDVGEDFRPLSAPVTSGSGRSGIVDKAVARAASAEDAAARRLQLQFPEGIPEPDPNNPLANTRPAQASNRASARTNASASLLRQAAVAQPQIRRGWEQRQTRPQTARPASSAPTPVVLSASGFLEGSFSTSAKQSDARAAAVKRQNEKEFGKKVAMQLDVSDPRKDLVRKQQSRFQAVVDNEKVAKRHRDLAELEAQDAMAEKMEAIMSISVQAWKCKECESTTESHRSKMLCEEQGHSVTSVTAQKTRWECKSCHFDAMVLDRELPKLCGRCKGDAWKPVPLRRVAKAKMERDMLLARGEEMPFLNSIPTSLLRNPSNCKRFKEAADDYDGL